MDNMLYIIAGLVLILIVVGVVLRKNKAQKPSTPPSIKSDKSTPIPAPIPKTAAKAPTQSSEESNKFDPIETAQRFIDQQRYDKAIQTLDRGLSENPDNSQLTLKLLSIYATINQPDNFNKVYDIIKTQNDSKSIAMADELKELFSKEQSQAAAKEAPVEDSSSFDSIDFDLSDPVDSSDNAMADESVDQPTLSNDIDETNTTDENPADAFDLTLSDLESSLDETNTSELSPAASSDITADENLDAPTADSNASVEENDFSDFDFDLDSSEETAPKVEEPVILDASDAPGEEQALDSEEFILDFDDIATDADEQTLEDLDVEALDTKELDVENLDIENLDIDDLDVDTIQTEQEDSADLSLDDIETTDNVETALASEETVAEESHDFDNFIIDDHRLEDDSIDENSLEVENLEETDFEIPSLDDSEIDTSAEEVIIDQPVVGAAGLASVSAASMLLDSDNLDNSELDATDLSDNSLSDNNLVDDSLPTELPTAETPVEVEDIAEESVGTNEELSSRFAADFDFVKSLDSNQVTLDLATQYLQLGEYDSAKRLLNEVITQGNSDQQSQAKLLLERTA